MSSRFKRPTIPNPVTQRKYRRSVTLEIYLPLILGTVVIGAALAGIVVAAGGGTISSWADASLVLLILPGLVIGLLLGALFVALGTGLWWLIKEAPPYFKLAQDYAALIARTVRKGSNKVVAPVVRAESILAAVRAFFGR